MPKGKNCPNCGAPYDPELNKCPFCGTIYFDMSCLDFVENKPIYLKYRMNLRDGFNTSHQVCVLQKVIPQMESIEMEAPDEVYCTSRLGTCLVPIRTSPPTVTTNISFRSIEDVDGTMIKVVEC